MTDRELSFDVDDDGMIRPVWVARAVRPPRLEELVADVAARIPVRRKPGRPRQHPDELWSRYRRAIARLGPRATDVQLAEECGYTVESFDRLIRKHGRPPTG